MASLKCATCGNILKPIPICPKHNKELVVGEINGIPSLICPVEGESCTHQQLPKCCSFPAYCRWI